jgi:hypothetical protein
MKNGKLWFHCRVPVHHRKVDGSLKKKVDFVAMQTKIKYQIFNNICKAISFEHMCETKNIRRKEEVEVRKFKINFHQDGDAKNLI